MSDWKPGEPITARKLNAHSASRAQTDMSGPPGSFSKFGQNWAYTQADLTNTGMWIRVTGNPVEDQYVISEGTAQKVKLHSWEAIYWNDGKKMWQANPAAYGNASLVNNSTVHDYDAVIAPDFSNLTKTLDANITANNTNQTGVTPYFAVRDPVSRRLIAVNTAPQQGTFNATSTETVLMILGTYDEYKNCPGIANVVSAPPKAVTDFCNGTTGTDLCVPAYAYAVYQRCGYVWNKIGDTRTYKVWANEMNGGTGAERRLYIPRWGGNLTANGPDPNDDCMGVAFLGTGASALTCTCPPCLSSPPANVSLCVKFRTTTRPETYNECGDTVTLFDNEDLWDKEVTITLDTLGCTAGGNDGRPIPVFDFEWQYIDGPSLNPCDWGPNVFDPCDPCEHWGRVGAAINIRDDSNVNCGSAGHWRGEFKARDICNLMCNCTAGPIFPTDSTMCDGCGNNVPPIFYFIDPTTVKIECCT